MTSDELTYRLKEYRYQLAQYDRAHVAYCIPHNAWENYHECVAKVNRHIEEPDP